MFVVCHFANYIAPRSSAPFYCSLAYVHCTKPEWNRILVEQVGLASFGELARLLLSF